MITVVKKVQRLAQENPTTFGVLLAVAGIRIVRSLCAKRKKVLIRKPSYGASRFMASMLLPKCPQECIINNILRFPPGSEPDLDLVKQSLQNDFLPYVHFHSVPLQEEPGGEIHWIPRSVNVNDHLIVHPPIVETKGDELEAKLIELLNTPLDKTRPWWEVHYVKSATTGDSALDFRIHHALGDGISLVQVFAKFATDEHGKKLELVTPDTRVQKVGGLKGLMISLYCAADFVAKSIYLTYRLVKPYDAPNPFFDAKATYKFINREGAKWTMINGTVRLDDVKKIKNSISKKTGKRITVNDVLFGVYAGAVRKILLAQGHDPSKTRMHVLSTAFTPSETSEETRYLTGLGNLFTVNPVELPVSSKTILERILKSNKAWSTVKTSMLLPASILNQKNLVSLPLPFGLARRLYYWHALQNVSVFSNTPGPTVPAYMYGVKPKHIECAFIGPLRMIAMVSSQGVIRYCYTLEDTKEVRERIIPYFGKFFDEEMADALSLCD